MPSSPKIQYAKLIMTGQVLVAYKRENLTPLRCLALMPYAEWRRLGGPFIRMHEIIRVGTIKIKKYVPKAEEQRLAAREKAAVDAILYGEDDDVGVTETAG